MGYRILHTNMHRGGWGGQPNRILLVSRALMERGHHVVIAAPKGATLIKRAKELGIPVFDELELPKKFKPWVFVKEVVRLKNLIERERIEIVHTHGSQDSWVASIAAKLVSPPRVVVRTRHNIFWVRNHAFNRLLYRVLTDYLILVSEGILDVYKRSGVLGERINRTKAIYSVVEPERFKNAKKEAEAVRREFSLKRDDLVFVKVARLAREKGYGHFVNAAKSFLSTAKAKFFALGEGPCRGELEDKVRACGISRKFIFTGLRRDVPGFLLVSDMFVFTPVAGESLGTAALEALYMETPVAAFKVGGIDASVRHGKNGFLFAVGDEKGLLRAMKTVFNRKVLKKLGITGRKVIERSFLIDTLVEGNLWVYRRLLNQNG